MKLTPRQKEVIDLLLEGKTRPEICKTLGIREQTIKHLLGLAALRNGIDHERYHLSVRLMYLAAVDRGLIR